MKKPRPEWAIGLRDRELCKWMRSVRKFCTDCGLDEEKVGAVIYKIVVAGNQPELVWGHRTMQNAMEMIGGLCLGLRDAALADALSRHHRDRDVR